MLIPIVLQNQEEKELDNTISSFFSKFRLDLIFEKSE